MTDRQGGAADPDDERIFTRPFLLCFVANLLQGLAFNLFLHFPGYLHGLGAGDAQIGLISSLTAVAAIAMRPPIGRLMDQRGRRIVILWGGALNVAVVGAYLGIDSIGPALYAVRVLHGLAEAMLFSALFTYAADHVPARVRTQGLALFGVSGILPIALGGVIGDVLLARADYAALFLASLAFSVVSLVMSFPLPEEAVDRSGDEGVRGLRAALVQRDLVPLWWIGTVFSIAVSSFFIFIKRFVDDSGVGTVGLFFSMYTAAALFLRVFLGWLPDRLGPKRVLGPALVMLAAGCACMALARDETALAVAGLLCGVGHGFTFPILFGLVVTRAPESNRGTCMAVFTALFDVGVLVGGPSLGWLVETQGFARMYLVAGLLTLFGSATFFALDARQARR